MSEEMKNMELNEEELKEAAGGCDGFDMGGGVQPAYIGGLESGYLAVRTSPRPGADNQIGGLLNGDRVTILGEYENGYTLIRAYCKATAWTLETGWQTGWAASEFVCPTV